MSFWLGGAVAIAFLANGCWMGEPQVRSIGAGLDSEGKIRVLYNPCDPENRVSRVKVVAGTDSVSSNKNILWDIETSDPMKIESLTLGRLPIGFTVRGGTGLDDLQPRMQIQIFQTKGRDYVNVGFSISDLRTDEYFVAGKHLSEDGFFSLDTCKSVK